MQTIPFNQVTTATSTLLGRVSAATGSAEALTGTQATALLDVATTSAKGLLSATDKVKLNAVAVGWTGGIDGTLADAETINLGFATAATTLTQANCAVWAKTGATSSTVLTLWKRTAYNATPVQVLTATFAAAGQGGTAAATIAVQTATIESGAAVYWTGPATADATLADLNYVVR